MNYESEEWRMLPDGVMRPGGLELTEELVRRAGLIYGCDILDIGCGDGAAVRLLLNMGFCAVGLDISDVLIARGLEYGAGTLIQGDAVQLPFNNESFDAIISECVISETSFNTVLRECARVLRPDGGLLISDMYLRRETAQSSAADAVLLTRSGWESALRTAGFYIEEFHERTELLTEFMIKCVWSGTSCKNLQNIGCLRGCNPKDAGYFMIIARKTPA